MTEANVTLNQQYFIYLQYIKPYLQERKREATEMQKSKDKAWDQGHCKSQPEIINLPQNTLGY